MGNVSYQVECIEGDIVQLRETYDLTDRTGPGILMRDGKTVDCEREGIRSASRFIMMTKEQAIELGIALLPAQLRETIDRLNEGLTSSCSQDK